MAKKREENQDPRRMTREELDELNQLLNTWDRESHPPTMQEVGDYPEPPEFRYDRDD